MRRGLMRCWLGAATFLAACQPSAVRLDTTPIRASESAIRFEHPDYLSELAEHAAHRDAGTGDEAYFARFHGPESRAVVVALRAGPRRSYPPPSRDIETGLLLPDAELLWGDAGRASSALGQARFWFFRVEDVPLSCLAFNQSRGAPGDRSRPHAELLYGYFCRDELRPLTAADAAALLASVEVAWPR